MASVKVTQLQSAGIKGSYLNIRENAGNISVWGTLYNTNVILCRKDYTFTLITFDDYVYYKEWLELHSDEFDDIQNIYPIVKE